MKYIYQARNREGKEESGTVEASTKEAAALLLQKYDIFVTSIKPETPAIFRTEKISFLNKVSTKDLAIFSRQLAVMLQSRVPVTQSLESLAVQTKNPVFKEKISKLSQLVQEGNSLSKSMENYPEVFNIFFISLIRTGEASGRISESLSYLSDHLEREHDISSQIKNALIYPAFVIVVLFVVVGLVMFFVMPRMMDLIKQTGVEPPAFTKFMISFYGGLSNYGWVILIAFVVLVLFIIYYMTTKEGKKTWNKLSLKIPFFGDFLKKTFLIMFAENISTLIAAGLSINNALEITRDTVDNFVYREVLTETGQRVSEGERISSVFVKYPDLIPPFVVQMIQVGEETGKLDKNLLEIVNFYNKEVKRAVELFTAMLEPVLIIFLGTFVAILAVSVIQPLYGTLGAI